jgi:putative SOS response-associated peptidase YedK
MEIATCRSRGPKPGQSKRSTTWAFRCRGTWHGVRSTKANPVEGEHPLFGFLTTNANDVVAPVHPKAMPVILTSAEEIEVWMTAPAEEALRVQRPLPNGMLEIVARGDRKDVLSDVP